MRDADFVTFLTWALPSLGLRHRGFRRVRRQVRRRVARRLTELGIADLDGYRVRLADDPQEWRRLDEMCRISVSRFHRDSGVFEALVRADVLPELARHVRSRGDDVLRCWSAGCASGEEPYTVAILWDRLLAGQFPDLTFDVTASDASEHMLDRARAATYPSSSLRELPAEWRDVAFVVVGDEFRLRDEFRGSVHLERHDVREEPPGGPFDLVLCRNLAFTYFAPAVQRDVLRSIHGVLVPGGALVVGRGEVLPDGATGFEAWDHARSPDEASRCILRRSDWL